MSEQTEAPPRHAAAPNTAGRSHRAIALGIVLLIIGFGLGIGVATQATNHAQSTSAPTAGTQMLSVRRSPNIWSRVLQDVSISESSLVSDSLASIKQSSSCVIVQDGQENLVSYNALAPFIPASTLKLVVAYAALHASPELEPFSTSAISEALPADGVLEGDLFIKGTGDPLLGTDAYVPTIKTEGFAYKPTRLEDLADQIAATGIKSVQGDIVGDGTEFDGELTVPTWRTSYVSSGNVGPVSGLSINDGFANVGSFSAASDPPASVASALKTLLAARGVVTTGRARSGEAGLASNPIATVASVPIREVVQQMLTMSDNNTAEALLKHLAAATAKPATIQGGIDRVKEILTTNSIDSSDLVQTDGSGLDRGNRVTCRLLSEVIQDDPSLLQIASTGGLDGTLQDRFNSEELRGQVHAKTGTLDGVSGLAGELFIGQSDSLKFVVIANDVASTDQAKDTEDKFVKALSESTDSIATSCMIQPTSAAVCTP